MNPNKYLIKLINEELSEFDFLGNDAEQKIQDINKQLRNPDLQKQFIIDSLTNKETKIKIDKIVESRINGDWEFDDNKSAYINLEYVIGIIYKYDSNKEAINFNLSFVCENISKDNENNLNWNDVEVSLETESGDKIEFIELDKTPINIQKLFIREYIGDYVNGTAAEIN